MIQIVEELVKQKIRFTAIKESIRFEGKQYLQTKVMIALFGLFAEVERDLISERTKERLAGGKEEEILILLQKEVSKASIAKIVGVSRTAIHHFINSRKLPKLHSRSHGCIVLKGYFCNNLGGTLTCPACCWPGFARRRCGPKAAS